MCDAIEDALQGLSVNLFNDSGKPRVACLKEALASCEASRRNKPFLYIKDMALPSEYRSLDATVPPKVLRSLLLDTVLKDRYSMAFYVPYGKTQYLEDDHERSNGVAREWMGIEITGNTPSDELVERRQKEHDRFEALTVQSMQQ